MPFLSCAPGASAARIHYAERGEPRPGRLPVLCVHGAGGSSAAWLPVLARLGRLTRAVAIDLPGHGPSAPLPEPVTLAAYRDAVGLLGATLGLGRAVLCGHSMGALVCALAAAAWPDKVAALLLVGAGPTLPEHPDLDAVIRTDYARFPTWLAERGLSPAVRPVLRRGFIAAGVVAPAAVTAADFLACRGVDTSAALAAFRGPILWLDGADDGMVPPATGRSGEVRTLPEVGHMLPIEAPAVVADAAALLARAEAVERPAAAAPPGRVL